MAIQVRVDSKKMRQIINELPQKADIALGKIAEEMVTDIKLSMQGSPQNGVVYTRRGRRHIASSAGNPPRPDMGALIGSIRKENRGKLTYHVMDGVEYGFWLETVKDRPWMQPAAERIAAKMPAILVNELEIE